MPSFVVKLTDDQYRLDLGRYKVIARGPRHVWLQAAES